MHARPCVVVVAAALVVCLGCHRKPPATVPVTPTWPQVKDVPEPEFVWRDTQPLPEGLVQAEPPLEGSAKQLLAQLREAYPQAQFAVKWTKQRLHLTARGITFEALAATAADDDLDDGFRDALPLRFVRICLDAAPKTNGLAEGGSSVGESQQLCVSAKQDTGQWVHALDTWSHVEWRLERKAGKEKGEYPPPALPLHYFRAARGYGNAAHSVLGQLRKACPDLEFSVAWDPKWVQVTFWGSRTEMPLGPEGPVGDWQYTHPNVWGNIVKMVLDAEAPPTERLVMSEAGGGQELGELSVYRKYREAGSFGTGQSPPK